MEKRNCLDNSFIELKTEEEVRESLVSFTVKDTQMITLFKNGTKTSKKISFKELKIMMRSEISFTEKKIYNTKTSKTLECICVCFLQNQLRFR